MVTRKRFASTRNNEKSAFRRRARLDVERLEDRNLLSITPLHGAAGSHSLAADPTGYEPSDILVRFRQGAINPSAATVAGTTLEPEIKLVPGLHKVDLAPAVTVTQALAAYWADPLVLYAEPDYHVTPTDTIPNNEYYPLQWDMDKIRAPGAWDVTTGSTSVPIAVLDSGLDYDHPDIYLNVWINQAEIPYSRMKNLVDVDGDGLITFWDLNDPINQGPGKVMDLTGKGYISASDILAPMVRDADGNDTGLGGWAYPGNTQDGDTQHPNDFIGWNANAYNSRPTDGLGHGTHVSGTIGAIGNHEIGVAGVNWTAQIMPLKIISDTGAFGSIGQVIDMVNFAVNHGALVSNNSWGGIDFSQALEDAIASAGQAGHIFVAAAGNFGRDIDLDPFYPPSYPLDNIIAVAATDRNDQLASFSNFGAHSVHLGAPGVNVYSTTPTAGTLTYRPSYDYSTGTSMAAPHVTGVVALLQGLHPDWTYDQIINQILNTVDPVDGLQGRTVTGGRLNAAAAVGNGNAPRGFAPRRFVSAIVEKVAAITSLRVIGPAVPTETRETLTKARTEGAPLLPSPARLGGYLVTAQEGEHGRRLPRVKGGEPPWVDDLGNEMTLLL